MAADGIERAHVVQPVGQLDQDDAHITRHGQKHLAEGLGLGGFAAAELHLVELGQAVDHLGHDAAELLVEFGLADGSVFQRVVQQGGVALIIAWVRDTQPEIVGKVMLITFEFGFITKLCTLLQPLASVIVT